MHKTVGEGKPVMYDFCRAYNIKKGVVNIHWSWDKVHSPVMYKARNQLWQNCFVHEQQCDFEEFEDIPKEVPAHANENGLKNVIDKNIQKSLDSHGQEISVTYMLKLYEKHSLEQD